jgi:SPP1 family predicted phage head-tail adaptor
MRAGALDRRVTLMRAVTTLDAFNQDVAGFTRLAEAWAERTAVSDGERVRAQQVGASVTHRFKLRWSRAAAGITPKDQLVCEGVTYQVSAVKELGRREGLEITASALADGS